MIVDSGTPIHIVYDHLFVSNTREDYTPVAGFSGNASRATHRGDLNARVHTNNNEYINIVDTDSVLATEAPVVAEYVPAAQSAHVFHVAAVNEVNTPARTHR
jgi:hypothetical protein